MDMDGGKLTLDGKNGNNINMQDAPSRRKGAFGKWRRAPDGGRIEKKNTEKDRANETGFPLKGMGKYFLFFRVNGMGVGEPIKRRPLSSVTPPDRSGQSAFDPCDSHKNTR